ncbi:MAG TPA: PhnD/SsuA/transferrin family substrate-binding protein [Albitalea sp.]|uniref:PhnD/SsuA/transferrin family substrate-binding protein n=1 Tax=Piscinibacter sp. TaxID=1903157 RepID=UPI002ED609C5
MTKWLRAVRMTCWALALCSVCHGALAAKPLTRLDDALVLGINEGATDSKAADVLVRQYASLAKVLSRVAGKPVIVEPYVDVALFRKRFEAGAFHFAFGKSVHVVAAGIVAGKYVPVVKNEKPYVAGFVVQKGSSIKDLGGLRGKTIVLPPADTYTSALVESQIAQLGIPYVIQGDRTGFAAPPPDTIAVRHFRIQDNVAKAVSVGLFPAGAVNPSVIARVEKQEREEGMKWKDTELIAAGPGIQVLSKLKPQTGWLLVANAGMDAEIVQRTVETLTMLGSHDEGKQVLKDIGCPGLVRSSKDEYEALMRSLYH